MSCTFCLVRLLDVSSYRVRNVTMCARKKFQTSVAISSKVTLSNMGTRLWCSYMNGHSPCVRWVSQITLKLPATGLFCFQQFVHDFCPVYTSEATCSPIRCTEILLGAKPYLDLILINYQLGHNLYISMGSYLRFKRVHPRVCETASILYRPQCVNLPVINGQMSN